MSYSSEVLADSPVLYLQLDETSGTSCADSSTNAFTGTTHGTVTRNVSSLANLNVGVTFGGTTSDYIDVPDNAALDVTGNVTYECWVNYTSRATSQMLMSKGWQDASTAGYTLYISTDGTLVIDSRSSITGNNHSTTAVPNDGIWHHCVVTRTGSTFAFYIDGVAAGTTTDSNTTQATSRNFVIGAAFYNSGSIGFPYTGSIDEVAVYTTALSGARILVHYNAGEPAVPIVKAGAGIAGSDGAGASESIFDKVGHALIGGVGSGSKIRSGTSTETGAGIVGLIGAGVSESAFAKTGRGLVGMVGSGASVYVAGDSTPPSLQRRIAFGNTVQLIYDEPLQVSPGPSPSEFAVTVNGAPSAVSAASVTGTAVNLTIATTVEKDDDVLVSYVP
jgi:uncharacterized repeat protein (TIGR02059 family)